MIIHTFVVCTMTAIVVLSTGYINLETGAPMAGISGDTLVSQVFGKYFGVLALFPLVLAITKNYIDRKVRKKNVAPLLSYDPAMQAEMEESLYEE